MSPYSMSVFILIVQESSVGLILAHDLDRGSAGESDLCAAAQVGMLAR
jgi:hypothetical protein